MIGRERAGEVVERYGGNSLKEIAWGERIAVRELSPWTGRFQDIFVNNVIFVPPRISIRHRRVLVAHCLGHHFMHAGNQAWLRGFDSIWSAKQEHQAEEFAAFLLVPELDCQTGARAVSPETLVRRFDITIDVARLRVQSTT